MNPRLISIPLVLFPLLILSPPLPLPAQAGPEVVAQDWARFEENVLAMVDAMPEDLYGFRPTEGGPSFSELIEELVRTNLAMVGYGIVQMAAPPTMGNPRAYLRSQRELRDFVQRTFEFVEESVAEAGDLAVPGSAPDLPSLPRWRILDLARERGARTLGQLAVYLSLNGIPTPPYSLPR